MSWLSDLVIWLYHWQTLIGAGLALLGAGWTVRKIREQILQSHDQREDEIVRRHRAARVTLPLSLAAVSDVIREITENACSIRERLVPEGEGETLESIMDRATIPLRFQAVMLSQQAITSFETFVETLSDPDDIKHVHELIASVQILLSRYNSFNLKEAGAAGGLERLLLAAARVKVLNDAMFSYAREPSTIEFSLMENSKEAVWDSIHEAAQGLVFLWPSPDLYFRGFAEVIDRKKHDRKSPWVEGGAL